MAAMMDLRLSANYWLCSRCNRLLRRTEAALFRLEALSHDALVYVFSHGQFMQALRSTVTDNGTTDKQKMEFFTHR
jgi:broad specificity phosphatase PhoE